MAATRQGNGKRHLLDSAWAAKLFAWLSKLLQSDVRDEQSPFSLAQEITEYRDTAPTHSLKLKPPSYPSSMSFET